MKQRRLWTPEEDKVLKYLRQQSKIKKWSLIAKMMQEDYNMPNRTGKQCRQRYFNHLDSQIKRQQWSQHEEQILYEMHFQYGNRWTLMANKIKGRSQNCIKNHFYSKVRKSVRKLNKIIVQRYRTEFKEIKTSLLYKILESAEDKFRPGKSSDNQILDAATNIKNKLFLYESQSKQNSKQPQITKILIADINSIEQKLKKYSHFEKNSSGFLDPKSYRKHNFSFDNSDNSSIYSSTSYNSSFQGSQQQSQSSQVKFNIPKTTSLKIKKRSFQQQPTLSQKVQNSLLGSDLKFKSLQLRPSRSQKTLNIQLNIQDKVSDIDQNKPTLASSFDKCLSDIVKFEQSDEDFEFNDDDFLNPKCNKSENNFNFFDEPGGMQFQYRVLSPKVPSDEGKIQLQLQKMDIQDN